MNKSIYFFGEKGKEEVALLGGKGANLAEMVRLGIPVPPGFTVTTEVCRAVLSNKGKWPTGLKEELQKNIGQLENLTKKGFGNVDDPLLVSVRSGAAVSMPGMMDTVLNLGLNDATVEGVVKKSGNARFAWDSYRRFIQMYSDVVLGVDHSLFEDALQKLKVQDADSLRDLVTIYHGIVREATGKPFPQDVWEQLNFAISAVFDSWNIPRAVTYRNIHGLAHDLGTAVNVQAMVFGNRGETSGTGVAFTRSPATGEKRLYGEYLINAQGEDVVAGIRTPEPIDKLQKTLPHLYDEFVKVAAQLELHFRDMQDIEFTIEEGTLYLLQTRNGKRTAAAAVKVAVEMVEEKLISKEEALLRVQPEQIDLLLHPSLDPKHLQKEVVARGLPASPGAASGIVAFSSEEAVLLAESGKDVILVRKETCPDDISGMHKAQGILTSTGGMTSHAAVVCRGMNKCCIVGCLEIVVNEKAKKFTTASGHTFQEGDRITLDGSTGEVIRGDVPTIPAVISGEFETLMSWADEVARLGVRANADTPVDATVAREFGASGIGLCRTEHMFFSSERIPIMQEMILAETKTERVAALNRLEVMQTEDFYEIFKAMRGYPVTVRLLDPPLHEFLPKRKQDIEALAVRVGKTYEQLRDLIESLWEANPMMGHRGCRLMITWPEITEMQTRAIIRAACILNKEGIAVSPEIMVPLVGTVEELKIVGEDIRRVAAEVIEAADVDLTYKVGTMIELPRATVLAEEIANEAEFFSFGTNDLTQFTFGYSRDDINKFLGDYKTRGILKQDPFMTIDQDGVGKLVAMGVRGGRATKKDLKIGVCGEHGGDAASIHFFHKTGLDYVSCSPYRVPVARLAAAQAALADRAFSHEGLQTKNERVHSVPLRRAYEKISKLKKVVA